MLEQQILDSFEESAGQSLIRDLGRIHPVLQLQLTDHVPYLTFPKLSACDDVKHLISIRAGGVSTGQFATMNFSSRLGDQVPNVLENFRRVAKVMGRSLDDFVSTVQTHTTNILRVTRENAGSGIARDTDFQDMDGLVTNEPGIVLSAYAADCVPLFFVDPVCHAIGLAHSGWRGTVSNMAGKMVARMGEEFGSKPENLIACIGPSICQSCYEVDEVVAKAFMDALGEDLEDRQAIADSGIYPMQKDGRLRQVLEPSREAGHYYLDLWLVNLILLYRAGVSLERIDVTDVCTAHNSKLLFSHRASHGKRGNMGAFLMLNGGTK